MPKEVSRLVNNFHEHLDSYTSGQYNEAQLRTEFLDPFFKALGWDMGNVQGLAEAYKDVVHEDAIRIGAAVKAPDYCFRIGGTRKFFLEAKKPSVDISGETSAAYQLRRYAWSAKLPLSVLSDFEEFAVYDCRIRPNKTDSASVARVFYCRFTDYPQKWDWISSIFSKDAVLKGSFDKYADENKAKRGTAEVDDDFLATIEKWRSELARNLALRNSSLAQRELNFAVQRIIDRVIFLRICEDRGIEQYGRLLALTNGPGIYARLCEVFEDADAKYNSGLFHFEPEKSRHELPDQITLKLDVDDRLLRDLLRGLYYPESPYEFTVFSADILGQAYEQFLGKVIRLTEGHHAVIEDKPEVKKAGGVYYTPTYIVEYIVKQTVGKLVEGRSPKQVAKLRILDPACGSGSFLINAYQFLLDWHHGYYLAHNPAGFARGRNPVLVEMPGGWKLTIAERKRILLDNIYGVDIDPQAVEVTKLSLLLKVLEGESEQTIQPYLRLFQQRALPDLGDNIKCGNSLIEQKALKEAQLSFLTEEDRYRVNAFDWDFGFPQVMGNGGFDAIIGNPPYIRIQTIKQWTPVEVDLYRRFYRAASLGNYDIYVVFIERGLTLLNKYGQAGFILPHKFFNARYGEPLRRIISAGKYLSHVVHFGDLQVFKGATTYTCMIFLNRSGSKKCRYIRVDDMDKWRAIGAAAEGDIPAKDITSQEWNFVIGKGAKILNQIKKGNRKLCDIADIFVGLQTSADAIYVVPMDSDIEMGLTKPFLLTGNLAPFANPRASARLIFPYKIVDGRSVLLSSDFIKTRYPRGWEYLVERRDELMRRNGGKMKNDKWYAYVYPKNLAKFDSPKLILQVTAKIPTVMYDASCLYMTGGGSGPFYGIRFKNPTLPLKYLLGVMNSSLFGWVVKSQSTNLRGGYFKFSKQYISTAPIITPDESNQDAVHEITGLVDRIMELRSELAQTKTPHEQEVLNRSLSNCAKDLNYIVYELYGFGPLEIAEIEELITGK